MISEDDGSQGRDSEMILFLNYQMSMPKIIRIGDCLLLKKANLIRADLNRVRSVFFLACNSPVTVCPSIGRKGRVDLTDRDLTDPAIFR